MTLPATATRARDNSSADGLAATPLSESELSTVVSGIGPRLRALRARHSLSLQQLADRSDVSPAAIHKVEQSSMVPTITTLLKLAAAFQVPVAHFIDEADLPATPIAYTPATQRRVHRSPNGDVVAGSLSAESGPFDVTASLTEISGSTQSPENERRQPGESLVYVQSGTLDLTVRWAGFPPHTRGLAAFPFGRGALMA